jgi:hypothetical protein
MLLALYLFKENKEHLIYRGCKKRSSQKTYTLLYSKALPTKIFKTRVWLDLGRKAGSWFY